jgi:hypothetical protein
VSICALVVAVVLSASGGGVPPAQAWKNTAPESFRANAQANGESGGAAAAMTFQVDAYTPDATRKTLLDALASGGSPAFVEALKKEKAVGYVQAGDRKITIRYARAEAAGKDGRRVVLVTDAPVYFVGAGALDAKPTAGFDVAVVEFEVDSVGLGSGTMAAGARVKPGGPTGVQVDDYAGKPIKLTTVTRNTSR